MNYKLKRKFINWIGFWIEFFQSIIAIVTFGFFAPYWTIEFISWDIEREYQKYLKNKGK